MNNEVMPPSLKADMLIVIMLQYIALSGTLYQATSWLSSLTGISNRLLGFAAWLLILLFELYTAIRVIKVLFSKRR